MGRLIDCTVTEMIQNDMQIYQTKTFSYQLLPFTEHLSRYLSAQYGLPKLARTYFKQIQDRCNEL